VLTLCINFRECVDDIHADEAKKNLLFASSHRFYRVVLT
jgi:hypothetical protein